MTTETFQIYRIPKYLYIYKNVNGNFKPNFIFSDSDSTTSNMMSNLNNIKIYASKFVCYSIHHLYFSCIYFKELTINSKNEEIHCTVVTTDFVKA